MNLEGRGFGIVQKHPDFRIFHGWKLFKNMTQPLGDPVQKRRRKNSTVTILNELISGSFDEF